MWGWPIYPISANREVCRPTWDPSWEHVPKKPSEVVHPILLVENTVPLGKPQPINTMCEVFLDSVVLSCAKEMRKDQPANPATSRGRGADQDSMPALKATTFRSWFVPESALEKGGSNCRNLKNQHNDKKKKINTMTRPSFSLSHHFCGN